MNIGKAVSGAWGPGRALVERAQQVVRGEVSLLDDGAPGLELTYH